MKQAAAVRVSVIIPVYNTAPYLRRCLDSVCGQTLKDIEIICVDDGSTDDSPEFLREFAQRDGRILPVFLGRNCGVSVARNIAISASTGKYLCFVDSDDALADDFCEKLFIAGSINSSDIVKGTRIAFYPDGRVEHEDINDRVRKNKFSFNFQWSTAIYNRQFINKNTIAFPYGISNNEDLVFLKKSVALSNSITFVDSAQYLCYRRPVSACMGIHNYNKIRSILEAQIIITQFFDTLEIKSSEYIENYIQALWVCRSTLYKTDDTDYNKSAIACASTLLTIYTQCREQRQLDERLSIEAPTWHPFLTGNDTNGLVAYLANKRKPYTTIAENLRLRVKRGNNNDREKA